MVEVDATLVAGNPVRYGVIVRRDDEKKNDFRFFLEPSGGYIIHQLIAGKVAAVVPRTHIDGLVPTNANRIKVVAQGNKIALYVNDRWLYTMTDPSPVAGYFGIVVGGQAGAEAAFDNLKASQILRPITIPGGNPPTAATALPAPTQATKYPLPSGKGGLIVRNFYGADMTFTIANQQYTVPANGETFIVLDPGTYPWSAFIPGKGQAHGSATVQAGRLSVQSFAD